MRNSTIDRFDDTPRPIVALGNDYAPGHVLRRHSHRRAQLLFGASGVMSVATDHGNWVVPSQCAVWIPPGVAHEVGMIGVSTRSLYIEPGVLPSMSADCQVLEVPPLMRQLLMEAVDLPAHYDETGRDGCLMQMLLHELPRLAPLPLHIPLPTDTALADACRDFLVRPDAHASAAQWAMRLHVSERTFNRRFREQTGMSFGQWRQRACVVVSLPRLFGGQSVTAVAIDLGYDSPAAFATMFRRSLGRPPSEFSPR